MERIRRENKQRRKCRKSGDRIENAKKGENQCREQRTEKNGEIMETEERMQKKGRIREKRSEGRKQ